jgi:uncharacterized membrane protein
MRRALAVPAVPVLLLLALPVLALPLLTGPAQAAFNVCNKATAKARVAIGRFDGTAWTSMGWWSIAPKSCTGLLTGPLDARYYYLYATDGAAGTWEGSKHFCVAPNAKFSISGRANCSQRGYDRRGFFEIDTGGAPDWTQTLSN